MRDNQRFIMKNSMDSMHFVVCTAYWLATFFIKNLNENSKSTHSPLKKLLLKPSIVSSTCIECEMDIIYFWSDLPSFGYLSIFLCLFALTILDGYIFRTGNCCIYHNFQLPLNSRHILADNLQDIWFIFTKLFKVRIYYEVLLYLTLAARKLSLLK